MHCGFVIDGYSAMEEVLRHLLRISITKTIHTDDPLSDF